MRVSLAVIAVCLPLSLAAAPLGLVPYGKTFDPFAVELAKEARLATIVVSDPQTEFSLDGKSWSPALATWIHPAWPKLPGATWIWRVARPSKEEAVNGSPVITFRRTFMAPPGVAEARLTITADNAYRASFNGRIVGAQGELAAASHDGIAHWRSFDAYTVPLRPGENVLLVQAVNYRSAGAATGEANPGGIVFSLAVPE